MKKLPRKKKKQIKIQLYKQYLAGYFKPSLITTTENLPLNTIFFCKDLPTECSSDPKWLDFEKHRIAEIIGVELLSRDSIQFKISSNQVSLEYMKKTIIEATFNYVSIKK